MTDENAELTSALLDGELDRKRQVGVVSDMLSAAPSELERFGRYRLIGDVLRGESTVLADNVVVAVRAALQDEPVVLAPARKTTKRWLRPLAGLAVAASVASVAVIIAPQVLDRQRTELGPAQVASSEVSPQVVAPLLTADRSPPAVNATGNWSAIDQELEARLNRLVIEHHEFGGRTGINGPVPHIGLVSYGAR